MGIGASALVRSNAERRVKKQAEMKAHQLSRTKGWMARRIAITGTIDSFHNQPLTWSRCKIGP